MNIDHKCPLLVHPTDDNAGTYHRLTTDRAGWKHLNFGAKRLPRGAQWSQNTGTDEYCIVLLGGRFTISSPWGEWTTHGGRDHVFGGLPHAAYLPPNTSFTLTVKSAVADIAFGYTAGDPKLKGFFVTPDDVERFGIELRGGDNASRQINSIIPPGSPVHRIVCVEVYTPSGNWSSFPAHKHDIRRVSEDGHLLEACLEEVYFYKFDKPQGFALQKVYTDDRTLNEIAEPHGDDLMMIPRGYHPVCAGHGYNTYYLNFLGGSDQSLKSADDPDHKWIYTSWKGIDPRVPMVTLDMNLQTARNEKV